MKTATKSELKAWGVLIAVFLVFLYVCMTGCAQVQATNAKIAQDVQNIVAPIQQTTLEDAKAALAIANANGDTDGAACYADIVADLSAQAAAGGPLPIAGVLSALEAARTFKGVQIPAKTHRDCAVLVVDAQQMAIKLGIQLAPVVGGVKVQAGAAALKTEAAALKAEAGAIRP